MAEAVILSKQALIHRFGRYNDDYKLAFTATCFPVLCMYLHNKLYNNNHRQTNK